MTATTPDPGTPDPGTPDHGTPDPGTPDPSTPDPGPETTTQAEAPRRRRFAFSRRRALGAAGAGVAVGAGAFAGGIATARAVEPTATGPGGSGAIYPFYGAHQAGITTPAQDRLHFAAFDLTSRRRDDLIALLRDWTAAAVRMTAGQGAGPLGPTAGSYDAPPDDTGEAIGLPPSGLTLTFGLGPSLFRDAKGEDRYGIAARRPAALTRLPHFPHDALMEQRSDGDLCVQACADDPQVAVHAIRNLSRIGFGTAALRWSQLGFGRTSSTSQSQATPRNLFGFKDGTDNLKAEETAAIDSHVWVQRGDDGAADWLAGGSYLVARRINMRIETWDRQSLGDQENIVGRTKAEGAPLSGGTEFAAPNFAMKGNAGPIIPDDSHVRLAHPDQHGGARMLRRGYNFVDGSTGLGRLDAGLFFVAFIRDPRTHFIPIQNLLARSDAMTEYLQHTGSGLFAVPAGVSTGRFVGQELFD